MMPKKCPRCEINYLMDGEKICSVCRKSVHMEDEPDEIVEMCSECGEHPAMPGSELCAFCRKELADGTVFPVRLRPAIPPRAVGACWLCAMELSGAAKEFLHLLEGGAPSVPQAQKG